MDKIKSRKLRRAFMEYVTVTFGIVVLLSALTIWGCFSIRSWILPDTDEVWLNMETVDEYGKKNSQGLRVKIGAEATHFPQIFTSENNQSPTMPDTPTKFSITSVSTSFHELSPKRQLLYHACGTLMVALPIIFSVAGILVCGLIFYKRRLQNPIEILSAATEKIGVQDLDFEIETPSDDELGLLCTSFEQMRSALVENSSRMWSMLEERRRLQASVAHDLRNPIAIIESHVEYLQINFGVGNLPQEKVLSIMGNIEKAAKRLERYTDSIRTINNLEELEILKKPTDCSEMIMGMEEDFIHMAALHRITLRIDNNVTEKTLEIDSGVLYRILENLIGNAVRYAKSEINISFSYNKPLLEICVCDDGSGFSEKILRMKSDCFISESKEPEHSGIGLTISRILCKKHGGEFILGNNKNGGAKIQFSVST